MTRSRFFFNSSIIRQNLRQHGWIGLIYILGLLFSFPLQMFMNSDPNAVPQKVDSLFQVGGSMQMLFIITLPVAAGLFLFRYLQAKMPSDLWHSLPLRREHLLTAHMVSGLGLLLLPVWLTAAVAAIVRPLDGNMYIYQGADIWNWCLTVSILTLFLFVFSVFVGICTGQTVLQGIIIYILLILPAALIELINQHLRMYLYGYPEWYGLRNGLENWSPFLHIMNLSNVPFHTGELWAYTALIVLFLALSFGLYSKRQGEKAGQAIAFTYFNPLFKAGVMLCAMLISGTYFGDIKQQQLGWVIGGHVAGALIGYTAAEMIIRKTWQILTRRASVEFAMYGLLLGLLLYIPVSGMTGYENRVPAGDKISGVYLGSNYRAFTEGWNSSIGMQDALDVRVDPFTEDKEYIEAVRKLHLALATVRPEKNPASTDKYIRSSRVFTVAYQLENGRKLLREYRVPEAGFEPELKAVMTNKEFKSKEYNLNGLDMEPGSIRLSNRDKSVVVYDSVEIQEIEDILRTEILNMSYEDQTGNQMPRAYIELVNKSDKTRYNPYYFYNYNWLPSYKKLESWLVQKGYAGKIQTSAKDVKSAEIIQDDYRGKLLPAELYNLEKHLELARNEKRSAVTRDAGLIADILEHQRGYTGKNGDYVVKMDYQDGSSDYISLYPEDLTPGLKSLLP